MSDEILRLDRDHARRELHHLLATRAFTFGDFVLTSGRRSNFYFDGKQVTLDGRGLALVSLLILDLCREQHIEAVGGLTLGADPIAAGVATLSGLTDAPIVAFLVRKEAKGHGTQRFLEGPQLAKETRVLIVDDVITTGGSLQVAAERAAEAGATVAGVLAIVDREEGGRETLEAQGYTVHALFKRSEFSAPVG